MKLSSTACALALIAACSGGSIQADVAMPRPGGVTQDPSGLIISAEGVVTKDGVDPCERLQVKVFTAPPTKTSTPKYTGGGLGKYDASSPTPMCQALAAGIPAGQYWVRVEYPEEYYARNPSIRLPGQPGRSGIYGEFGPVTVVDKQTTRATVTVKPW